MLAGASAHPSVWAMLADAELAGEVDSFVGVKLAKSESAKSEWAEIDVQVAAESAVQSADEHAIDSNDTSGSTVDSMKSFSVLPPWMRGPVCRLASLRPPDLE